MSCINKATSVLDEDLTRLPGIWILFQLLHIICDTTRFAYPVQHIATNSSSTMPLTKVSFFPALNVSEQTKRIQRMLTELQVLVSERNTERKYPIQLEVVTQTVRNDSTSEIKYFDYTRKFRMKFNKLLDATDHPQIKGASPRRAHREMMTLSTSMFVSHNPIM